MRKDTVKTELIGVSTQAKALGAAVSQGFPALLIGETGTGKTTLARDVAAHLERPTVRVNLDGGTTVDEVIGRYQLRDGATMFELGVIPRAMQEGAVLILDEINAALPDVLFCIHALLERPARLFIPETREEVAAAPGFCVIGTQNPSHDYAGTKALNAALYSRFGVVLRFDALRGDSLLKALAAQVPAAPAELVAEIAEVLELIESKRQEECITTRATIREGIAALMLATDGLSTDEAVRSCIVGKLEPDEQQHIPAKSRPRSSGTGKISVSELLDRARGYEQASRRVSALERELDRYKGIKSALEAAAAQEAAEATVEAAAQAAESMPDLPDAE